MNDFNIIISIIMSLILCVILTFKYSYNYIEKIENDRNLLD